MVHGEDVPRAGGKEGRMSQREKGRRLPDAKRERMGADSLDAFT